MKKSIFVVFVLIAVAATNCRKEEELIARFRPILGTWLPISQDFGSWGASLNVPINYDQLVINDKIEYYKISNSTITEEGKITIQSQSEESLLIGFIPKKVDESNIQSAFRMSVYVKLIGNDTLRLYTLGSDGGYMSFLFNRLKK
jgi:hypothetical protein